MTSPTQVNRDVARHRRLAQVLKDATATERGTLLRAVRAAVYAAIPGRQRSANFARVLGDSYAAAIRALTR